MTPKIKHLLDHPVFRFRNPHASLRPKYPRLIGHCRDVIGSVFTIYQAPVEPGSGSNLCNCGATKAKPNPVLNAARLKSRFQ